MTHSSSGQRLRDLSLRLPFRHPSAHASDRVDRPQKHSQQQRRKTMPRTEIQQRGRCSGHIRHALFANRFFTPSRSRTRGLAIASSPAPSFPTLCATCADRIGRTPITTLAASAALKDSSQTRVVEQRSQELDYFCKTISK